MTPPLDGAGFPIRNRLEEMTDFDVIIVGGGIAGASLGAEIASKRRTLIVEAEDQCGYHATGRSAAFYLESYGGPEVAKLTLASRPIPGRPAARILPSTDSSACAGILHITRDELPELPPSVETRVVERAELERLIPGIRPEWRRALFEPGCADIDVAAFTRAYLRQFRRYGGEVETQAELDSRRARATSNGRCASPTARRAPRRFSSMRPGPGPTEWPRWRGRRRSASRRNAGRWFSCESAAPAFSDLPLVDASTGPSISRAKATARSGSARTTKSTSDPCDAAPEEIDVATRDRPVRAGRRLAGRARSSGAGRA